MNHLYYGDNLDWLRDRDAFPDGSVDLIYLDPPFNSNASYNVLFRGGSGAGSAAQIEAFDDTWTWDDTVSGQALVEVRDSPHQDAARMLDAMVGFLGKNAMTAYLSMMGVRLIELHRVLKDTGSLYLHCDPTASHYLKILLDAVFGAKNSLSTRLVGIGLLGNARLQAGRRTFSTKPRRHPAKDIRKVAVTQCTTNPSLSTPKTTCDVKISLRR